MNSLNLWITELCICSIAVAVAENLLPEGNVKKAVYFVLGIVVLTCFVSPVENFNISEIDMDYDAEIVTENTDWFNRTTDDIFKNNVKALIENCLKKMNIEAKNIDIHTDINDDNCIFIDKARITVAPEYSDRIDEIADEIYRTLGIDADVKIR